MATSTPQVLPSKPFFAAVVTDLSDHLAHQLVEVDMGTGGDLTQQHHEAGLGGRLAGHPRSRVLLQAGIQHRIADLVADLIRVAFGDRLRR